MTRREPDWNLWRQVPTVKAWEAVALSLNVDPKVVKHADVMRANAITALRDDKIGREAKKWALLNAGSPAYRFDESVEFNERLEVTTRNGVALPSVGAEPAAEYSADRLVQLPEFAAVAKSLGWAMPDKLEELANSAAQKSVVDDEGDLTLANIQQTFCELRTKTGKTPSQRAVAKKGGYNRETVRNRWPKVKKST